MLTLMVIGTGLMSLGATFGLVNVDLEQETPVGKIRLAFTKKHPLLVDIKRG